MVKELADMTQRNYKVAHHVFRVRMEEPWGFADITPEQEEVIRNLASGGDAGVIPVQADRLADLKRNRRVFAPGAGSRPAGPSRYNIDMSQYEPFREDIAAEPLYTLDVKSGLPEDVACARENGTWKTVVRVEDNAPFYYGHLLGDRLVYEFFPEKSVCAAVLVIDPGMEHATIYPNPAVGPTSVLLQISTSLMVLYTFRTADKNTLLLHSSVIRHNGKANLFFGISGTGKSTHSRLWLENIPGCDLMNDDNPVIRFMEGPDGKERVYVFGTPWSGKTYCYRNVSAPVRALVRLERGSVNTASRLTGLNAYASVLAATSVIRWNSRNADELLPVIEKVAMSVPCWVLGCTAEPEAARVCHDAIEGENKIEK